MAEESKNVIPFQDKAITYTVNGLEVRLTPAMVKQYLVTGHRELVTDQEIVYFMNICRARELNPFNKDCYLIKYTDREAAAIIVSIEKLRMVARQSADCVGWEKGIIVQKKDGELRYSKGLILEGETLLGGYFKAKPKGWEVPFELEVNLKGYIKTTKDGSVTQFWKPEKQPTMIAKVAEAQGLRTVWPERTQGLYVSEEIGSTEAVDVDFHSVEKDEETPAWSPVFADVVEAPSFELFVKATEAANRSKRSEVVRAANENPGGFLTAYNEWLLNQPDKTATAAEKPKRTRRTKAEIEDDKAKMEAEKSLQQAMSAVKSLEDDDIPVMHPDSDDPETSELDAVMSELNKIHETGPGYIYQAQKNLKLAVGFIYPKSLDGCVILLDEVRRIKAEREKA